MKPSIIQRIFIEAFYSLKTRKLALFKALIVPLSLLATIDFFSNVNENQSSGIIAGIADFVAYCYVAIITHRIIILGPESVPNYGLYIPTSREFVFAGHFVGLAILVSPLLIMLALLPKVPEFIIPVTGILLWYIMCRVSLVFPAIAVDKSWTYTESWIITKKQRIVTIATIGIFPVMLTSISSFVGNFVDFKIVTTIMYSISTVLIITVLSATYIIFTNGKIS